MICPHCGKQTYNKEHCDFCGNLTEFVKRSNYQSVGTSDIEVTAPAHPQSIHANASPQGCSLPEDTTKNDGSTTSLPKVNEVTKNGHQRSTSKQRKKSRAIILLYCVIVLLVAMSITSVLAYNKIIDGIETISAEKSVQYCSEYHSDEAILETTVQADDNTTSGDECEKILLLLDVNYTDQMGEPDINYPTCISIAEQLPSLEDIVKAENEQSWHFTGWNTKADGTGIDIPYGIILELPLSKDITLFAQWESIGNS